MTLPISTQQLTLSGRNLVGLIAIFLAGSSFIIEATATNIVLPSLGNVGGLAATPAGISWIISAPTVAMAVALVPAGRLGDLLGQRLLFVLGAVLFAASGVLASAVSDEVFVATLRIVHGAATGLMIAGAFALIQIMFAGNARIKAIAYYTAMTGLVALGGPLVAGWLLDSVGLDNGWRWVLALGTPFALVAAVVGRIFLPPAKGRVEGRYDVVGAVLLAAALVGLIVPVISITGAALPDWAWPTWGATALLIVLFVLWQRRVDRRGGMALVPPRLFKDPQFSINTTNVFLIFISTGTGFYLAMAIIWQLGREEMALATALATLPFSVGAFLGALASDRLTLLLRRWVAPAALTVMTLGYLVTALMLIASPTISMWWIAIPTFFGGLASGVVIAPLFAEALAPVPEADAGSAAGMVTTGQFVGTALGSAVVLFIISMPDADGGFTPTQSISTGVFALFVLVGVSALAVILSIFSAVRARTSFETDVLLEKARSAS